MDTIQSLIKDLANQHGRKRESLIPMLQGIVDKNHCLTEEAMLEVAKILDISAAEIYGTASFFSFIDTEATGKNKIRLCKSISCDMKGKKEVVDSLERMLKIKVGETTPDERFSLLETNCIGLCDEGPAMLINDDFYTNLTPQKVREVIGDYLRNKF